MFPWLATVIGMLAAYILILLSTTVLFGLTVSLFNDAQPLQPKLTGIIFLPVFIGIVAMLWQIFKAPELNKYWLIFWTVLWYILAVASMLARKTFREAVKTCANQASTGNTARWPIVGWFMLMLTLLLVGTVISAVFPASLILKAYIGEDTPEAINRLMFISMFTACAALLPVVIFYVSQADLFKRLVLGLMAVLGIGAMAIVISPGSPAAIVYAAALIMNVRDPVGASFLLTKTYAKEDFDSTVWGTVETRRGQPVVSAFPLFSFGDALLLCPTSRINKQRKDWPQESVYCVLTQSSNAIRVPKRETPAAAPTAKQVKKTRKSPAKCSVVGSPSGASHDAATTC